MSTSLTNIRVFVQWTEQTVFAGEDIECQITFKNVATATGPSRSLLPPTANGFAASSERGRKAPSLQIKGNSTLATLGPRGAAPTIGHHKTLSLNVAASAGRARPSSGSYHGGPPKSGEGKPHRRSLSIISMGASEGTQEDAASHGSLGDRPGRMARGHGRSASLQIVPRRHGIIGGPTSGD